MPRVDIQEKFRAYVRKTGVRHAESWYISKTWMSDELRAYCKDKPFLTRAGTVKTLTESGIPVKGFGGCMVFILLILQ